MLQSLQLLPVDPEDFAEKLTEAVVEEEEDLAEQSAEVQEEQSAEEEEDLAA